MSEYSCTDSFSSVTIKDTNVETADEIVKVVKFHTASAIVYADISKELRKVVKLESVFVHGRVPQSIVDEANTYLIEAETILTNVLEIMGADLNISGSDLPKVEAMVDDAKFAVAAAEDIASKIEKVKNTSKYPAFARFVRRFLLKPSAASSVSAASAAAASSVSAASTAASSVPAASAPSVPYTVAAYDTYDAYAAHYVNKVDYCDGPAAPCVPTAVAYDASGEHVVPVPHCDPLEPLEPQTIKMPCWDL
ncbi:hypothetical protein crov285 [Cafeteria roenbergensis virus]|uniref:Uncharacterized protein n=1 Tax=Cafeteria roenbergensis virus (strain BV-PW1) TaxID=693272 RepID=E3T555_CROVB|nr:hypothetical protein crov285 [Cafeteria roenbergensis virus BV-PW1]ADO67318.1 hypothetical protein crov285 [Cafeteria roenbergensis virus BV-PW1]